MSPSCPSEVHPRESWSSPDRYDRCDGVELDFVVPKSAGARVGSVGVVAYMALPRVLGREETYAGYVHARHVHAHHALDSCPRRWSEKEELSLAVQYRSGFGYLLLFSRSSEDTIYNKYNEYH